MHTGVYLSQYRRVLDSLTSRPTQASPLCGVARGEGPNQMAGQRPYRNVGESCGGRRPVKDTFPNQIPLRLSPPSFTFLLWEIGLFKKNMPLPVPLDNIAVNLLQTNTNLQTASLSDRTARQTLSIIFNMMSESALLTWTNNRQTVMFLFT